MGVELDVNLLMDFAWWFGSVCIYSRARPLFEGQCGQCLTLRVLNCCICFSLSIEGRLDDQIIIPSLPLLSQHETILNVMMRGFASGEVSH